eukprot:TRINITY_DN624_c0_g1_i1.p1 TRINITY_DN624_c0_g1~~TRINITY_DN624_c0_g1_i1.p1  ORF type:complete len:277 (-),score=84.65 TRINITY_DN624_c0_g1_i1:34-864(-)
MSLVVEEETTPRDENISLVDFNNELNDIICQKIEAAIPVNWADKPSNILFNYKNISVLLDVKFSSFTLPLGIRMRYFYKPNKIGEEDVKWNFSCRKNAGRTLIKGKRELSVKNNKKFKKKYALTGKPKEKVIEIFEDELIQESLISIGYFMPSIGVFKTSQLNKYRKNQIRSKTVENNNETENSESDNSESEDEDEVENSNNNSDQGEKVHKLRLNTKLPFKSREEVITAFRLFIQLINILQQNEMIKQSIEINEEMVPNLIDTWGEQDFIQITSS